jgi:hypothetical protein
MPTKRRMRPHRRTDIEELDDSRLYELQTGHPLISVMSFDGDVELMRLAWEIHGEDVLADFIAEHPGRRPFAWWLFDHGKERPIVADWPTWTPEVLASHRSDTYGFLHTEIFGGRSMEPLQEPETDYLRRLGLLTESEL